MDELTAMARNVLDANRYLVLGTTDDDGRARTSPVYFNHAGYRDFYWISGPNTHHSHNVAARPLVSFVVFDSSVTPAQGPTAVYVDAEAAEVPKAELAEHCAVAFAEADEDAGVRAFGPDDFRGDARLRLYRARATRVQVHVRGGDPAYGTGVDRRVTVQV